MTIEQILEIVEKYKLRMPPTAFYELKADIVNFEEPTTENCESCRYYGSHHKVCNYCYECSLWTEQEPTTKNNLGVDCISRAELIKRINNAEEQFRYDNMETIGSDDEDPFVDGVLSGVWSIREMVKQAPSVTPQEPRKGHWILDETDNSITCDKCGCLIWANDISNGEAYYCPNCGADMREVEDGNDD